MTSEQSNVTTMAERKQKKLTEDEVQILAWGMCANALKCECERALDTENDGDSDRASRLEALAEAWDFFVALVSESEAVS